MTASEIQAKIDAIEQQLADFAGIRGTAFSDQSIQFSVDDAHKELARLKALLAGANRRPTSRLAATSKGA